MTKSRIALFILTLGFAACNSPETDSNQTQPNDSISTSEEIPVTENLPETIYTNAYVDQLAMDNITEYMDADGFTTFEIYNAPDDEYENWAESFWGRCCTEADMTFSEYLSFKITTSHEGKSYPFSYALDEYFNTAYVFEEKDHISIAVRLNAETTSYRKDNAKIIDMIDAKDTVINPFRISIINGYVKSEKAYQENARIAEVELWLNGEHHCNCKLLDTPEAQVILGNFPFFKNDLVEIKPVKFYDGSVYDDICLSAIQFNLGDITHPELNKNYSIWK